MSRSFREDVQQFICRPQQRNTTLYQLVVLLASQLAPILYLCNFLIQSAFSQSYYTAAPVMIKFRSTTMHVVLLASPAFPYIPLLFKRFAGRFQLMTYLEFVQRYVTNPLMSIFIGYDLNVCLLIYMFVVMYLDCMFFDWCSHCGNSLRQYLPQYRVTNLYALLTNVMCIFFDQAYQSALLCVFLLCLYEIILNIFYLRYFLLFQNLTIDFVMHCISGFLLGATVSSLVATWSKANVIQLSSAVLLTAFFGLIATWLYRRLRCNCIVLKLAKLINYITIAGKSLALNATYDVNQKPPRMNYDFDYVYQRLQRETNYRLTDLYYYVMSNHICAHTTDFDFFHGFTQLIKWDAQPIIYKTTYSTAQIYSFLHEYKISALEFNVMYLWLHAVENSSMKNYLFIVCRIFDLNKQFFQSINDFSTQQRSQINKLIAKFLEVAAFSCVQLSIVQHYSNFAQYAIIFLEQSIQFLAFSTQAADYKDYPAVQHFKAENIGIFYPINLVLFNHHERKDIQLISAENVEVISEYARRCTDFVYKQILLQESVENYTIYETISNIEHIVEQYCNFVCNPTIPTGHEQRFAMFSYQLQIYLYFATRIKLLFNHISLVNKFILSFAHLEIVFYQFLRMLYLITLYLVKYSDDINVFATIQMPYGNSEAHILSFLSHFEQTMARQDQLQNREKIRILVNYLKRMLQHTSTQNYLDWFKHAYHYYAQRNNYYLIQKAICSQMQVVSRKIDQLLEQTHDFFGSLDFEKMLRKTARMYAIFVDISYVTNKLVFCYDCLNYASLEDRYLVKAFQLMFDKLDFSYYAFTTNGQAIKHLQQKLVVSKRFLLQSESSVLSAYHYYEICVNLKFKLQYQIYLFAINLEVSYGYYSYANQLHYIRYLMRRFLGNIRLMLKELYRVIVQDKDNFFALLQLEQYLYDLNINSLTYQLIMFFSGDYPLKTLADFSYVYIHSYVGQLGTRYFNPLMKMKTYCSFYDKFLQNVSEQTNGNAQHFRALIQGRTALKPERDTLYLKVCDEKRRYSIKDDIPQQRIQASFEQYVYYKNIFLNFFRGPACLGAYQAGYKFFKSFNPVINDYIVAVLSWFSKQKQYVVGALWILFVLQWMAYLFLKEVNSVYLMEKQQQFQLYDEFFNANIHQYGKQPPVGQVVYEYLLNQTLVSTFDKFTYYFTAFLRNIALVFQLLVRDKRSAHNHDTVKDVITVFPQGQLQETRSASARDRAMLRQSNYLYLSERYRYSGFQGNVFVYLLQLLVVGEKSSYNLLFGQLGRYKCNHTSYLNCLISTLPKYHQETILEYPYRSGRFTVARYTYPKKFTSLEAQMLPEILRNAYSLGNKYIESSNYYFKQKTIKDYSWNVYIFPYQLKFYQAMAVLFIFITFLLVCFFAGQLILISIEHLRKIMRTIDLRCYLKTASLFPHFLTSNQTYKQFRILSRYTSILKNIIEQQYMQCKGFRREMVVDVKDSEVVVPVPQCKCKRCGNNLFLSKKALPWRNFLLCSMLLLQLLLCMYLRFETAATRRDVESVSYNTQKLSTGLQYQRNLATMFYETKQLALIEQFDYYAQFMRQFNCTSVFDYDFCRQYSYLYNTYNELLYAQLKQSIFLLDPQYAEKLQLSSTYQYIYNDLMDWTIANSTYHHVDYPYVITQDDLKLCADVLYALYRCKKNEPMGEYLTKLFANKVFCRLYSYSSVNYTELAYQELDQLLYSYHVSFYLSNQQHFYKAMYYYSFLAVVEVVVTILQIWTTRKLKIKGSVWLYTILAIKGVLFCIFTSVLRYDTAIGMTTLYNNVPWDNTLSVEGFGEFPSLHFRKSILSSYMIEGGNFSQRETNFLSYIYAVPSNYRYHDLADFLASQCNYTVSGKNLLLQMRLNQFPHQFKGMSVVRALNPLIYICMAISIGCTVFLIAYNLLKPHDSNSSTCCKIKKLVGEPLIIVNVRENGGKYFLFSSAYNSVKICHYSGSRIPNFAEQARYLYSFVARAVQNEKTLNMLVKNPPKFTAVAVYRADGSLFLKPASVLAPQQDYCHDCYMDCYYFSAYHPAHQKFGLQIRFGFPVVAALFILLTQLVVVGYVIRLATVQRHKVRQLEYYIGMHSLLQQYMNAILAKGDNAASLAVFKQLHYYVFESHNMLLPEQWVLLRQLFFPLQPLLFRSQPDKMLNRIYALKEMFRYCSVSLFETRQLFRLYELIILLMYAAMTWAVFHCYLLHLNGFFVNVEKIHCSLCEV